MKVLQLHYTSCRCGQSGNAGFQTRSLTPGLRTDEQREIERRGVYRPPRDARQDPSDEEIARDFPRAFRWYTLESGRQALSRSSYAGRDYSGRWGNFFAHTLVAEAGELPAALWPIDLYEWEGWRERLSSAEDTDATPSPLPFVDLTGIAPAESFRLDELGEFLREEPGRRDLLARMGQAVLLGRDSSRAVVIRDTPNRSLYWVACLQKLFPPEHARALSYSTYQDDPRGCANVNATTGETDFSFDESERRFRFYMFDLSTGQHSDLPQTEDDYPAIAARWLVEEPGTLAAFFEFMKLFDHRQPEPGLIAAVHLFELASGRLSAVSGERLAAMIAFASSHATPEGRIALLEILGQVASQPDAALLAEDYSRLIRFLAEGARTTGRPEHHTLAFDAWLSLVHGPVLREGTGLDYAEAAWNELRRLPSTHAKELAARLLADPVCHDPTERRRQLPVEIPLFLLRIIWESLELTGRIPPWQSPEVGSLLAAILKPEGDVAALAQKVLGTIPKNPEVLSAISLRMRDLLGQGRAEPDARILGLAIGRALGRILAEASGMAPSVRSQLDTAKAWEILLGEWVNLCEDSDDPVSAFESYRSTVFRSLPSYEKSCLPWATSFLLTKIPEARRRLLALDWLRSREIDRFPEKLAGQCVALANLAIPLDLMAPESEETARLVTEAAKRLEISLRPDRPLMRGALVAAQSPQAALKDLRLAEIQSEAALLTSDDYAVFLDGFLHPALGRAGSQRDHRQILLATFSPAHAEPFRKAYLEFFKTKRKTAWPESLHAALRLWLAFGDGALDEDTKCLTSLEETGRQGLLLALGRLQPKQLDEVRQKLRKARIDSRLNARWEEMQVTLEKHRKSPWSKLVGIFVRQ
jgi:hypothetical protein